MANNFNIPNLMVLDTPGASDLLAANAPVRIQSIYWDGGASIATADRCVLTDSAGNSIFESTVVTSLSGPGYMEFPLGGINVKGLKLPTLTHGKLFVATV